MRDVRASLSVQVKSEGVRVVLCPHIAFMVSARVCCERLQRVDAPLATGEGASMEHAQRSLLTYPQLLLITHQFEYGVHTRMQV